MTNPTEPTSAVERATVYNEGVNGFHILTFVTDGYGNLIAEDMYGNHLGMVKIGELPPGPESVDVWPNLMKELATEAFETMLAHQRAGVSPAQVQLDRRADRAKLHAEVVARLAAEGK